MITFTPLVGSERDKLLEALRKNAENESPLRMRIGDTSFAADVSETDEAVIACIKSVPTHYATKREVATLRKTLNSRTRRCLTAYRDAIVAVSWAGSEDDQVEREMIEDRAVDAEYKLLLNLVAMEGIACGP